MKYINESLMNGLDARAFQGERPYPWLNPEGFLTPDGFARLAETLPEPEPAPESEKPAKKPRAKKAKSSDAEEPVAQSELPEQRTLPIEE